MGFLVDTELKSIPWVPIEVPTKQHATLMNRATPAISPGEKKTGEMLQTLDKNRLLFVNVFFSPHILSVANSPPPP